MNDPRSRRWAVAPEAVTTALAAAMPLFLLGASCGSKGDTGPAADGGGISADATCAAGDAADVSNSGNFVFAAPEGDASWSVYDGKTIHASLFDANSVLLWPDAQTVGKGGATGRNVSFAFVWTGLLSPDTSYRLDFYIDVDGSKTCTEGDPVWTHAISTKTGADGLTVDGVCPRKFTVQYAPTLQTATSITPAEACPRFR